MGWVIAVDKIYWARLSDVLDSGLTLVRLQQEQHVGAFAA